MKLVKMTLKGIVLDPVNHMPVILLKHEKKDLLLPIWIGIYEANAIVLKLDDVETPRPMTHDLLKSTFQELGATLKHVVISKVEENTFYAEIHAIRSRKKVIIDSRPSDAIALAVRCDIPIYAEEDVLSHAQSIELGEKEMHEQLKQWFESLDSDDFGKYKM